MTTKSTQQEPKEEALKTDPTGSGIGVSPTETNQSPYPRGETNQTHDGELDVALAIKLNNQKRVYEQHGLPWPPPNPNLPAINVLNPAEAEIGGEDVTMVITGSKFTEDSVIVFNGGDENTVVVSDTEVSTIVKPSLAGAAVTVPVFVRNSVGSSNELPFAFVEPEEQEEETRSSRKKGK